MVKPRLLLCATALLLGVTAVHGQRVEKVICLPDSLSGIRYAYCAAFNPANDRVYIGGVGHVVIVVDATSFEKVAMIDLTAGASGLVLNSTGSKLYAARSGSISIVDVASNSVSKVLDVGCYAPALCYSGRHEKLYCTDSSGSTVTVVDCSVDTILATIPVGQCPTALCLDSAESKLYCANQRTNNLSVIDVAGDSVLKTLRDLRYPSGLCCNTKRNKIYCVNYRGRYVSVIDPSTDSIVAEPRFSPNCDRISYNSASDKVYCYGANSGFVVISCSSDSVVAQLHELLFTPTVLCDSVNGRVYCAREFEVVVLNGATDSIMATVPVDNQYCFAAVQVPSNHVWLAGEQVLVFDTDKNEVEASVATGCRPTSVCFSTASHKLYVGYLLGTQGEVAAIDPATNTILRRIRVPDLSTQLCYNSTVDKIYTGQSPVSVISCVADSVVDTIWSLGSGRSRLCSNPDAGEVYFASTDNQSLATIDAFADTVSRRVHVGSGTYGLCYNPLNHCVYVQLVDSNSVAAIKGDAVAAVVHTDLQEGGALVLNPLTNCLYDAEYPYAFGCRVAMIDCGTNQLLRCFQLTAQPSNMCCNTHDNRIYVSTLLGWNVFVLDGADNSIDSFKLGEIMMGDIFYNPLSNHVYCDDRQVYVIDGTENLVIDSFAARTSINIDRPSFTLNPDDNRVYALADYESGVMVIQDTTSAGVAEKPVATLTGTAAPTIVRDDLFLPRSSSRGLQAANLMDAAGRNVMDLRPGSNDVRALAPGVYFIREEPQASSFKPQAVRKIVVTR